MYDHLPTAVLPKIKSAVEGMLADLSWSIEHKNFSTFAELLNFIDEHRSDDTATMGLNLDDRLALVEAVAEDWGIEKLELPFDDLRSWIENQAAAAAASLATAQARQHVDELEKLMKQHHLEFADLRTANNYAWAVHRSERQEGNAQVYEYRKVESEVNVDVWEVHFGDVWTVFLEQSLDD